MLCSPDCHTKICTDCKTVNFKNYFIYFKLNFIFSQNFIFPKRGLAPLVFFSIRCARGSCIWLKKKPKSRNQPEQTLCFPGFADKFNPVAKNVYRVRECEWECDNPLCAEVLDPQNCKPVCHPPSNSSLTN